MSQHVEFFHSLIFSLFKNFLWTVVRIFRICEGFYCMWPNCNLKT